MIKNPYGADLELTDGKLSKETKEKFPECIGCWDDRKVFDRESVYCGSYGPCNLYPLIRRGE
jgi:hypothetical protein